jgi:hypothetical protein
MAVATWNKLSVAAPGRYQDLYEDVWETANGGVLGFLADQDITEWLDLGRPCRVRYTVSFNTNWTAGQVLIVGADVNAQPPQDYGSVLDARAATANAVTAGGNSPAYDKLSHHLTGEILVPNRYLAAIILVPTSLPQGLGRIWIRAFYNK